MISMAYNWPREDVHIAVITDGSRVLGITLITTEYSLIVYYNQDLVIWASMEWRFQ